jgi:hypothetical protein
VFETRGNQSPLCYNWLRDKKKLKYLNIDIIKNFVRSLGKSDVNVFNNQRQNIKEVIGVASVKEKRLNETTRSNIDNIINELEKTKIELKKLIEKDSIDSYVVDEIRTIQCIIDEARKIGDSSSEPLPERINKVLYSVDTAILEINNFRKNYAQLLPKTIFEDLKHILEKCKGQLDEFKERLEFIKKSVEPIAEIYKSGTKIAENSSKHIFERWAIAIEKLGEGLEDFLNLYPETTIYPKTAINEIENLTKEILITTAVKTREDNRKESYRRRLRYAANFIINLIEHKKSYLSHEKSYEIPEDQDKLIEDLMILSESGLDEFWLAPGEDEAWKNLLDT